MYHFVSKRIRQCQGDEGHKMFLNVRIQYFQLEEVPHETLIWNASEIFKLFPKNLTRRTRIIWIALTTSWGSCRVTLLYITWEPRWARCMLTLERIKTHTHTYIYMYMYSIDLHYAGTCSFMHAWTRPSKWHWAPTLHGIGWTVHWPKWMPPRELALYRVCCETSFDTKGALIWDIW